MSDFEQCLNRLQRDLISILVNFHIDIKYLHSQVSFTKTPSRHMLYFLSPAMAKPLGGGGGIEMLGVRPSQSLLAR